jgi:acetylglutamate kinase
MEKISSHPSPEARAETLIEALPYLQAFRGHTFVIKYGGSAMDNPLQVERLLRDIVFLEVVGINPVVVHGGGKVITSKMNSLGSAAKFVNGLRVTDEKTIQLVEEALDHEINPSIVQRVEELGGRARGFSGRTVFVAKRMPEQKSEDGLKVDIGFVGEVSRVVVRELKSALRKEVVPVISPIGASAEGVVLNINADIAATALAAKLRASKLIFISDVPGILRDSSNVGSLIPTVHRSEVRDLIRHKVVAGGMVPKILSADRALQKGVGKVHLISGSIPHGLLLEVFSDAGIGTEIVGD